MIFFLTFYFIFTYYHPLDNLLALFRFCYVNFRVEGKGLATISEVTYQSRWINEEQEESSEVKKVRTQIEALNNTEKVLKTKLVRLKKQRSVLDGFADRLVAQDSGEDKKVKITIL